MGFATVYTEEKIIKDNHNKQNIQQREACVITGASKTYGHFHHFVILRQHWLIGPKL